MSAMNKLALTLLCSSSFFSAILLTVNPAFAKKATFEDLSTPKLQTPIEQIVNAPAAKKDTEFPSIQSSQRVKQVAMQMFGCACSSCQAAATQIMLQGSLPQPQ